MDPSENPSSTEVFKAAIADSTGSVFPVDLPKIGRYAILKRIGKGGFGQVFLAYDDDLDRPVAIKVPRPERVSHSKYAEAFLREARILASLDHPHIVPVHDVGRTDEGHIFVVSKFIDGNDLETRIEQSSLPFHESAELVATVAERCTTPMPAGWSTAISSRATF